MTIPFFARFVTETPDFPKPSVVFKDILPVFANVEARESLITAMDSLFSESFDYVAAIEARGFLLGTFLAQKRQVGFLPIRKAGKLPPPVDREAYALEYGEAALEWSKRHMVADARVLIVDDVLATGGTFLAAAALLERAGAKVIGMASALEIASLKGAAALAAAGYDSRSLSLE